MCLSTPSSPLSLCSASIPSPRPSIPPIPQSCHRSRRKAKFTILFIVFVSCRRNLSLEICPVCPLFTYHTNVTFDGPACGGVTVCKNWRNWDCQSWHRPRAHSLTELKEGEEVGVASKSSWRAPERNSSPPPPPARLFLALRPQTPNENKLDAGTVIKIVLSLKTQWKLW